MKLILQTAIVFFGTLLAAALVALGEPATAEVSMVQATPTADTVLVSLLGADANPARQQLQSDYAAKLAAHRDAVLLNPKLFARVEALYAERDKAAPNAEAKRLIERYRRDMVRAGAKLCLAVAAVTIVALLPLDYLWWRLLGYLP